MPIPPPSSRRPAVAWPGDPFPVGGRLAIGACLVGFGGLLAIVRANRTAAFDLAVTLRVQAAQSPALSRALAGVSWLGYPPQSRIVPPLVTLAWLRSGGRVDAACQLAGWGTAALSTLVKAAIRRPRPLPPQIRVVVAPLGGTSFPSGHVLTYVGFYGFLAYLLALHNGGAMRLAALAPLSLVALVGPSRIQQGHHWPTDVLASYLLGTAYLLGLVELHRRLSTDARR